MSLIVSITLFLFLMAVITMYGYRRYSKPGQLYEQLATGTAAAPVRTVGTAQGPNPIVTVIQHIGEKVPISPESATLTRRYLMAAGYRTDTALRVFTGLKLVSAVALAIAV